MRKIAVIGAGSFSFSSKIIPDLMFFPELREFELCLMDIDPERLDLVKRYADIFRDRNHLSIRIRATNSLSEALRDAAYVVATFDIGGLAARRSDIEIPARFGIHHAIGDTLGPAGIFNALRMAPELRKLARSMMQICPEALLINYTNPMATNLRVILDAAPQLRQIGFCHGLEHSRSWLGRLLGMDASQIRIKGAGVNHQMWMLEITDQAGQDLYGKLRAAIGDERVFNLDRVRFELMELAGYFMTESSYHTAEYVPYFQKQFARMPLSEHEEGVAVDPLKETMETERLLAAHPGERSATRHSMGWGDLRFQNVDGRSGVVEDRLPLGFDVDRIGKYAGLLFDRFRTAVQSGEVPEPRLSEEYLARIIHGLETQTHYSIFGNVVNNGLIANLPNEAIVEVPVEIANRTFTAQSVGALPEFCAALNRNFLNVTLLVAEAVRTGSRQAVIQALAVDPITCANTLSIGEIRALADAMLSANAAYLTELDLH